MILLPKSFDAMDFPIKSYRKSVYPTTSEHNELIPIHALVDGELIKKKVLFYMLNTVTDMGVSNLPYIRKFEQLGNFLRGEIPYDYQYHAFTQFHYNDIPSGQYIFSNGILLYKEVTPLLVMTVKKKHLFNLKKEDLDPLKFCLVISKEFLSPAHDKMWRNVKRHYVDKVETDVIYVNDILETCYDSRSASALPKMKTFDEILANAQSINELFIAEAEKKIKKAEEAEERRMEERARRREADRRRSFQQSMESVDFDNIAPTTPPPRSRQPAFILEDDRLTPPTAVTTTGGLMDAINRSGTVMTYSIDAGSSSSTAVTYRTSTGEYVAGVDPATMDIVDTLRTAIANTDNNIEPF